MPSYSDTIQNKIYSTKTFGVEIECYVPYSDCDTLQNLAQAITDAGVKCFNQQYTHQFKMGQWKIVPDGSLRQATPEGMTSCEVVSYPLTDEDNGYEQIKTVCKVLKAFGAKVNKACGLHVHVGFHKPACNRVKPVKSLLSFYSNNEKFFDAMMPESRRGNENFFCKSLNFATSRITQDEHNGRAEYRQKAIASIYNNYFGGRYFKINVAAYVKYGTMEFRQNAGTVEDYKIINWIKVCRGLCKKAYKEAGTSYETSSDFDAFFETLKPYVDAEALAYMNNRRLYFEAKS